MPITALLRQVNMTQTATAHSNTRNVLHYLTLALCITWYATLLTLFWFHAPIKTLEPGPGVHLMGLTFNSMIDHLLHGRFDVDPQVVTFEGFLRDGKTYAYWGIFPALLRLPILLFPHGLNMDVTRLSCMIAASIMFLVNYKSWRYLNDFALSKQPWLSLCLFLTLAFSGAQICFLNSTIYQEVCLWALVFAVWFIHWAVRACLDPNEIHKALPRMALASGFALLTRVSFGIGLYSAFCLIALAVLWQFTATIRLENNKILKSTATTSLIKILSLSLLVLILFAGITAFVNYERWGSPFMFANYKLYATTDFSRSMVNGLFNIHRIPVGLMYFFAPIWVLQWPNGHFFFADQIYNLLYSAELPPSSFFLTDGFLLFLSCVFLRSLAKRKNMEKSINWPIAVATTLGLMTAPVLMLMAIAMNFRYRGEFYPPMLFMAFLGIAVLAQTPAATSRLKKISIALVCLSIIMSHATLVLYDLSDLGPSQPYLSHGVLRYYEYRVDRTNAEVNNTQLPDYK